MNTKNRSAKPQPAWLSKVPGDSGYRYFAVDKSAGNFLLIPRQVLVGVVLALPVPLLLLPLVLMLLEALAFLLSPCFTAHVATPSEGLGFDHLTEESLLLSISLMVKLQTTLDVILLAP
jgi:hypothetical protein